MKSITSPSNPRVKAAVRLRDGRHRAKQGRFLLDGPGEIGLALRSGLSVVEVYVCPARCPGGREPALAALLEELARPAAGREVFDVTPAVFKKLAFGDRVEGVVAVARSPEWRLDRLAPRPAALVAVIEGIEKPGNIGAVVRTADAAGVDAVILADCRTDLVNPNAIRASLGTILAHPVCQATTEETLAWLVRHDLPVYAGRVDGAVPYTQVDFRPGGAIVLGSEARGLGDAWRGPRVTAVRLPMLGAADSLNISATAAVLFYEALRQRQAAGDAGSGSGATR